MITKILALTDALGNVARFVLLPGQRFDTVGVAPLIEGRFFDERWNADKVVRQQRHYPRTRHTRRQGHHLTAFAPRHTDRHRSGNGQMVHLIENFICKLKEFKRIAMRADKSDRSFTP
ncbi:hypothetical protein IVA95_28320 [Bradyrhizobium sp. 157]|uniref:hypothetical protein n=1 Tax=Bradyrhizobium sp. 157 TaxID=2782631 RepID=UPI001FF8E1E0|nr:hypothetical protein [Bradyrhizobium sp. 157]MCK1641362.1 hypothetical protein [Bradyrhizobium sp. 157]